MSVTTRLYYDSHALDFDATVVGHNGDECRVILDRTAFYPTSGGQPHDTGFLNEVRVIDVIDADDQIIHVCERQLPLGPISGAVDPERRRDFTVQHTAQHLISALAADRMGWETVSVHFGESRSMIEFAVNDSTKEQLGSLEGWANQEISVARPVSIGYEDAASAVGLRKPTDRDGPIRIVTVEGVDRSACGGTHVTSTAQLGSVRVAGVERMRGRIRVGFLAGTRVLDNSRSADDLLNALTTQIGCSRDELVGVVEKRQSELRNMERKVESLERELAEHRARALISKAPSGPGGVRWVELHAEDLPVTALRQMGEVAATEAGVVFVATGNNPLAVVLAVSPKLNFHAGDELKAALSASGGRGGGSASLAQGIVPEAEQVPKVVAQLKRSLSNT